MLERLIGQIDSHSESPQMTVERNARDGSAKLSTGEILRLAHAMMYAGGEFRELNECAVVMSKFAPMHFITGIYADRRTAEAARDRGEWKLDPYAPENVGLEDTYDIFIVDPTPGPGLKSIGIDVCYHDWFTELVCPVNGHFEIRSEEIEKFELHVVLKSGHRPEPVDISPNADMISLRRTVLDRFVYPQYEGALGIKYVDKLRERFHHSRAAGR
jgi:hypothetical protein